MTTGSKVLVLVVDDDVDLRETIGDLLEDQGYVVQRASDGSEALELLRGASPPPSVILLDLMMPKMNGWEFRAAQLADALLASVPVIVMTASRNMEEHPIDASTVLLKPVRLPNLLEAIETHYRRTA